MVDKSLKLIIKCYDPIEYGYLYGLNKEIPKEDFEKIKEHMQYFTLENFQDPEMVAGDTQGWMCISDNVKIVEEILDITETVDKYKRIQRSIVKEPLHRKPLKMILKCYDSIKYGKLYGFNQDIPKKDLEKVKPYMEYIKTNDYPDYTKVTGLSFGWLSREENVAKIEEILDIEDTVAIREEKITNILNADEETKEKEKAKAMKILEAAYRQGKRPSQDLGRLLINSAKVYDLVNTFRDGKDTGNGILFIYTPQYIWYIINNGSGANQSLNNITTKTGGAIGFQLGFHEDLDRLVRIVTEENEYKRPNLCKEPL